MTEPDPMRARAEALHLHGLLAHWPEVAAEAWVAPLLGWEEQERARQLNTEYDQLQLEASTWAMHSRVEKIARSSLRMRSPEAGRVQVVEAVTPVAVAPVVPVTSDAPPAPMSELTSA